MIHKNYDDLLYLNLSDSIDHTVQEGLSFIDRIEDVRYMDKFAGFFFNLRNITKIELENFLMFFGADVIMLNDKVFMKNILSFCSVFGNEALLYYFMSMVTMPELYLLLSNELLNKSILIKLVINFNKNVRIETYRFFLTFRLNYKFLNFKRFKSLIMSNAFFFDDNSSLYHYYYFANKKIYDGDIEERQAHRVFFDGLLQERMSFFDVLYLKVDNLIYNLYNLNQLLKNYSYSYNINKVVFSYYNNYIIDKKKIKLPYKLEFNLYMNNIMSYFLFLHEIVSFFRYYIYVFYFLGHKNISMKLKLKYFKYFKFQFNEMIIFYKTYYKNFFYLIVENIYLLYNYVRKYIYLHFNKKNEVIYLNFFFKFQFILLKLFNLLKITLLKQKLSFDSKNIVITFNSFIFNKLKVMVPIGNFDELLNLFQFKDLLIQKDQLYISNILDKIIVNVKLPFFFKLLLVLINNKSNTFFYNQVFKFGLLYNYFKYFCKFFTLRTFYYFDYSNINLELINNDFNNTNRDIFQITTDWLINIVNMNINSLITGFIMLYSTVTTFMQFKQLAIIFPMKVKSLFMPHKFRITAVIDDFFFLLAEEFFGEDFTFFYDDELVEELSDGDRGDPEDEEDYFDEYFENETVLDGYDESEDYYMITYIDELISVNYYIHDNVSYKYKNLNELTEEYSPHLGDWFTDYDISRLSPFFDRNFILYGGEKALEYVNYNVWYEWVAAMLISDLGSFSAVTENLTTSIPLSRFKYINDKIYRDTLEDQEYMEELRMEEAYLFPDYETVKPYSAYISGFYPRKEKRELSFVVNDISKTTKNNQYISLDINTEISRYIDYIIEREIFLDTGNFADYEFDTEELLGKNKRWFKKEKSVITLESILYQLDDVDLSTYPDELNDQALFDDYGLVDYAQLRIHDYYDTLDFLDEGEYYKEYEEYTAPFDIDYALVNREFILLQETWVWWDCINSVYSNEDMLKYNKILKPSNKQELIFLNTFILSGLAGSMYENLNKSKDEANEEIKEDIIINEEPLKRFHMIFEKLLSEYKNSVGLKPNQLSRKLNANNFFRIHDSYYNNWLNKHTNLLFDNDYRELVSLAFIYNEFVLGEKSENELHPSLFLYLKKVEKAYINMVTNTYKSLMVSYYSSKKANKLLFFWRQIIDVLIEQFYVELEGESTEDFTDFEEEDVAQVNPLLLHDFAFQEETLELERMDDPYEVKDELFIGDYFSEYPYQMVDPYYLVAKGLNINYSMAETAIFDLYESYLDILVDSTVESYDFSEQIQQYRFFEDEDFYLRGTGLAEDYDDSIIQQYREAYLEWGYDYYEDRAAFETVDFSNYYISEASDFYVERMKSIKSLNFYLFSLFETYIKQSSFNIYNKLLESNMLETKMFDFLDLVHSKSVFDVRDLYEYKVQISYYYIFNLLNLSKYKNFNIYILRLLYFIFLNFFKNLKIPLNHHFFFLIFFSGYFLYLIVFFLKKQYKFLENKLLKLFKTIEELSIIKLYELVAFLFKKLYKYIIEYLKTLRSFFYKNYVFKKYFLLYKFLYKNNLYKLFFKLCSFVGNLNDKLIGTNFEKVYSNNVSFRSFLSTLNLYELSAKNKLILYDNLFSIEYFKGNPLKLVELHNTLNLAVDLNKVSNGGISSYVNTKLYSSVNMLEDIGYIESCFFDLEEAFMDQDYFDPEEDEDVEEFVDEWTGHHMDIGDISDEYDDEGFDESEFDDDEDDEVISEEEFSSELDLDSSLIYWFMDEQSAVDLNVDRHELWDYEKHLHIEPWAYRGIFFENKLFAIIDLYRRTFMLYLFDLYKTIPITTAFEASDDGDRANTAFAYGTTIGFSPDSSTYEDGVAAPVRDAPFKKLKQLYRSKELKKRFNKIKQISAGRGENYDVLIPKFVYLLEPIDYLDYYLDYNAEEEFAEFNSYFDNFDIFNGFSAELFKFSMVKNNSELAVLRLLNFFSFAYLYIFIYNYIDSRYSKFFYFSFFFFNFNILYSKYVKKYYNLIQRYNLNFKLFVKYVYDKLYMYLYKQLFNFNLLLIKYRQKVNYDEDVFYKEYKLFINLFIGKNYKLVSLVFFDFSFFVKKFFILKTIFGARLTNLSYIFLLKAIEWFLVVNSVVKLKDLVKYINFIMKRLYMFEYFVFFNAYKLAQIYARYGLMESFYFFQKNIQLVSIDKALQHVNKKYTYINKIIFIYEFIIFFVCISVFCALTMQHTYDFTILSASSMFDALYKEHFEENRAFYRGGRSELNTENMLAGEIYRTWQDVWGIF